MLHGFQVISRMLSQLSWIGVAVLMLSLTYDVFQRQADAGLVAGLVEYDEVLLVFVVFASFAYAQQVEAHISTDVVYRLLPPNTGRLLQAAGLLAVSATLAWMIYASWIVGLDAMARGEYRSGTAMVPTWPARLFIPVALGLLMIEVIIKVVRLVRGTTAETRPINIQDPTIATRLRRTPL